MTATEKLKEKYPQHIINCLRQREGLEKDDNSQDEYLLSFSNHKVFREVLNWNGLIGYDSTIKDWIKNIYGIDLE